MSRWNLWNEFNNVQGFKALSLDEQNRIVGLLLDKNNMQDYYADTLIDLLREKVDNKTYLAMAFNYLLHGVPTYTRGTALYNIVLAAYNIDEEGTKKILMRSTSAYMPKLLLTLKNLSLEEEERGLRALSNSKYLPSEINENKYTPTLDGIRRLPPIMRLKTLEALTNNKNLKYNIFKNISEDEFKALLFTPALKHTDRVQEVCNKFRELKHMGIKSTVEISGRCKNCGDYKIEITSKIIRTLTGARNTNIGQSITYTSCPFCYLTLPLDPIFKTIK